MMRNQPIL